MKKILKNKNFIMIVLGILCGVALFALGSTDNGDSSNKKSTTDQLTYDSAELKTYTEALEYKIENFLSQIKGLSNVTVILTVESSGETVYATEGENSDYVIIKDSDGSESAIPLTEITAKIRGIAVVCDYGENDKLKMTVIELLASLFDVGSNRISIISAG